MHETFFGLIARSGRTWLVRRSLQLEADDYRCVALASEWFVLRVDELGFFAGLTLLIVLQLTLSKWVIQYLLALGCFEGHLKCIPSRELLVGHWKDVAVVFCVFFRLDMLKYAGVMTNYFHPFRGINDEY